MSIALITGCSTGIGFATATAMARAGHQVFATMRNPAAAPELAALAAEEKLPIAVVRMDVDLDESVLNGVQEVLAAGGRIDVLVNNAGIPGGGPVEEADIAEFRRVMETNFFGVLRCTQAILPGMRQQRSGHIVNVSSVAGRMAMSPQAAYAASKWALEAMSGVGTGGEAVRNSRGADRTGCNCDADLYQGRAQGVERLLSAKPAPRGPVQDGAAESHAALGSGRQNCGYREERRHDASASGRPGRERIPCLARLANRRAMDRLGRRGER